ncbi:MULTISPECIES: hypothetical protein [Vibrio]|uniref:hypothetical protein n=1 Tax=Vibrio TaxID=662 RepID=UPI00078E853A|nr:MULTISPECIES: hypothetical protein [Vibrio]BAU70971.1 hypothetical protein [Vibrio sp. 04Ya108]BBM67771.1 hypothetical protein VA249_44170 [Vibrio alfacsensis]BCN26942.1 hypothetical protein VYA_41340 [Vibrio alfacsensis]
MELYNDRGQVVPSRPTYTPDIYLVGVKKGIETLLNSPNSPSSPIAANDTATIKILAELLYNTRNYFEIASALKGSGLEISNELFLLLPLAQELAESHLRLTMLNWSEKHKPIAPLQNGQCVKFELNGVATTGYIVSVSTIEPASYTISIGNSCHHVFFENASLFE